MSSTQHLWAVKPINVVSYNPDWPQMFEVEASNIGLALADHCLAIHHIGSTSVPGLAAKEDLDILCLVDALSSASKLQSLGYRAKGELNIPLRLFFSKNTDSTKVNLHVTEPGHGFVALNLCFRDYIRSHDHARLGYEALKIRLASDPASFQKVSGGFPRYTLEKNLFIKDVLEQAHFQGFVVNFCMHDQEWEAYHRLMSEKNHTSYDQPNHHPMVLYKGTTIVSAAHVEWRSEHEGVIDRLVTDMSYQEHDCEVVFREHIEQWMRYHGRYMTCL